MYLCVYIRIHKHTHGLRFYDVPLGLVYIHAHALCILCCNLKMFADSKNSDI